MIKLTFICPLCLRTQGEEDYNKTLPRIIGKKNMFRLL